MAGPEAAEARTPGWVAMGNSGCGQQFRQILNIDEYCIVYDSTGVGPTSYLPFISFHIVWGSTVGVLGQLSRWSAPQLVRIVYLIGISWTIEALSACAPALRSALDESSWRQLALALLQETEGISKAVIMFDLNSLHEFVLFSWWSWCDNHRKRFVAV